MAVCNSLIQQSLLLIPSTNPSTTYPTHCSNRPHHAETELQEKCTNYFNQCTSKSKVPHEQNFILFSQEWSRLKNYLTGNSFCKLYSFNPRMKTLVKGFKDVWQFPFTHFRSPGNWGISPEPKHFDILVMYYDLLFQLTPSRSIEILLAEKLNQVTY